MATLCLLLLSTVLIHTAQPVPAGRGGGRVQSVPVGGARRDRRDIRDLLPYEGQMMSYPASSRGDGAPVNNLHYDSDNWRGRGLDQALQRLVERDQRWEQQQQEEEQDAAYLAALLRLLSQAENNGRVRLEEDEEEEEEEDQGPPGDFQSSDYDDMGRGLRMGRPPAAWWGLLEPQLAEALLDRRLEPELAQALLERARQERLQQVGLSGRGSEEELLRRLVARILSSLGPSDRVAMSSARRSKRDLSITAPTSSAHRRARRSVEDMAPLSPSNDPPLLRVKRLEDEEEEGGSEPRPPTGLQRMKRVDAAVTGEEQNYGSRRRRRRATNYDPQILMEHILEYMTE